MGRYRTIAKAVEEIKKADPDTCLNYHVLKGLVDDELVSFLQTGNKKLVDIDFLFEYLHGVRVEPTIIRLAS